MQPYNVTESFGYDKAGRMLSKGNTATTATYLYGGVGGNGLAVPIHAPRQVGTTTLSYDQNGNMTNGLSGRIMTYDAENRPLSVTLAGKTTCYVYGAGGARLKKIENLAAGTDCKAISPTAPVTLYFGRVEVRNFRLAGLEQILTYPHPSVKLLNGVLPANASYLHRDAQGSVRQITSAAGVSDQRRFYLPYGAVSLSTVAVTNPAPDTKGWIGERFDADAGLQYLNARYYDPQLGMFLQPDWWEVMQPGVGTNRYSYSFGDPVNGIDPSGHAIFDWFFSPKHSDRANADLSKQMYNLADRVQNDKSALGSISRFLGDDERYRQEGSDAAARIGKSRTSRVGSDLWDFGFVAAGAVVPVVKSARLLATAKDGAVFWSGIGATGDQVAAKIASASGGKTLEMLLKERGIKIAAYDGANPASVAAWRLVSKELAEGASGTVRAVLGKNINPRGTWAEVELPALLANPKVDYIIGIDAETGLQSLIWGR